MALQSLTCNLFLTYKSLVANKPGTLKHPVVVNLVYLMKSFKVAFKSLPFNLVFARVFGSDRTTISYDSEFHRK